LCGCRFGTTLPGFNVELLAETPVDGLEQQLNTIISSRVIIWAD